MTAALALALAFACALELLGQRHRRVFALPLIFRLECEGHHLVCLRRHGSGRSHFLMMLKARCEREREILIISGGRAAAISGRGGRSCQLLGVAKRLARIAGLPLPLPTIRQLRLRHPRRVGGLQSGGRRHVPQAVAVATLILAAAAQHDCTAAVVPTHLSRALRILVRLARGGARGTRGHQSRIDQSARRAAPSCRRALGVH